LGLPRRDNGDGLVASLTFGGGQTYVIGFSIILLVRGPGVFTAYTAIYRPGEGTVDYLWPGKCWRQGFNAFVPGRYEHDYGG
jgi:predicted choloylglycine hydrolase